MPIGVGRRTPAFTGNLRRDGNPNRRVVITVGLRSSFHRAYRDPSAYDSIQRVLESFQLEGGSRGQRQRQRGADAVDPALQEVDDTFPFVKQALATLCRFRVGPILTYSGDFVRQALRSA